jgi:hypothetical protein
MIPFTDGLTEILDTKSITSYLPEGRFVLIELYCANPKCNCQHGVVNVLNIDDHGKPYGPVLATIDFSWKKRSNQSWQYKLHKTSPQTKVADLLLKCFKEKVENNPAYAESLQSHFRIIKEQIKNPKSKNPLQNVKIGRNDPCPCGSGKKYKKCCMSVNG